MSYEEVIFYFVAAVTVLGALGVVLARNVVHSALFLILALLAVAGVSFCSLRSSWRSSRSEYTAAP